MEGLVEDAEDDASGVLGALVCVDDGGSQERVPIRGQADEDGFSH